MEDLEKKWTDYAAERLVGRTIASVDYLSEEETNESGWFKRPLVIRLDDGTFLTPQSDDEGNDGGSIWFVKPGESGLFPVI